MGKSINKIQTRPRYVASFSGGKDSTAMVLRLIEAGLPLDEILMFDTGWEFPQMYEHIKKLESFTGRTVTMIKPRRSFYYWMFHHKVTARKGDLKGQIHHIGYGWPSHLIRWCTSQKLATISHHLKGVKNIQYIGMASDEAHRVLTGAMQEPNKRTPLIEWGMTEAVCLAYCKKRGFDWGGLYDHFVRVSCFCCPLQRIGELRQLRRYFPVLWTKMLRWDDKMERAGMGIVYRRFKGDTTIHDWERRFAHEQLGFDLFNKK